MNYAHITREPYRLFFPLGCLAALVGAGYWVLFSLKIISVYMPAAHASIQMQVFAHCFILGFLMTAMPRLTGTVPSQPGEVLHMALCVLGQIYLLLKQQVLAAHFLFGWTLIALVIFMVQRVRSRRPGTAGGGPPPEFVWLPLAMLTAWTSIGIEWAVDVHLISAEWFAVSKKMAEQGWVLGVICGVGGFLAPRLMGTFRAPSLTDPSGEKKKKLVLHAALGFLFLASFLLEVKSVLIGSGLRASVISVAVLYSLNGLAWPKVPEFYARLIWVSFLVMLTGLWGALLFPSYAALALHVLTIGGIALMIFAVATMVILTHQGRPELLRKPLPILWLLSVATVVSLILRSISFFDPEHYFRWAGISGAVWSSSVLIWFVWMLPRVAKAVDPGEVERLHEQAKQRIAELRK